MDKEKNSSFHEYGAFLKNSEKQDEELSITLILKRSVRHKKLILFTFLITLIFLFFSLKKIKENSYFETVNAIYNNSENNPLFRILDGIVPADDQGRVNDDLVAYSDNTIINLKGSEFTEFFYENIMKNSNLDSLEEIRKIKSLKKEEGIGLASNFLKRSLSIVSMDKKALVALKNSKGGFLLTLKSQKREDLEKLTPFISESIIEFNAKKIIKNIENVKTLINEKLKKETLAFDDLNRQKNKITSSMPVVDSWAIGNVLIQLGATKVALSGNKAMSAYFEKEVAKIQKNISDKLNIINEFKSGEINVNYLKEEISSLNTLSGNYQKQGIDGGSFDAQRLNEKLKSLTSLKSNNKSLNDDVGLTDQALSESGSLEMSNNVQKLRAENIFYENKIKEIVDILKEMNSNLNDRVQAMSEVKIIEAKENTTQRKIDLLQTALSRIDVSIYQAFKRIDYVRNGIGESKGVSSLIFLAIISFVSLILGMFLSLIKELNNPSLTKLSNFNELGIKVLGGFPSREFLLMNDESSLYSHVYAKNSIQLENVLIYLKRKIVLVTSIDDSLQSACFALNLGSFFSITGKKVLIIETDFKNNHLSKLSGASLEGGLSELCLHKGDVNISPYSIQAGLEILTGNGEKTPPLYRLASEDFYDLLNQLSKQYDYIFIHSSPCLDSPEASDLSRYAGVSLVTCDSKTIKINLLNNVINELKNFLSKEWFFAVESPEDLFLAENKKDNKGITRFTSFDKFKNQDGNKLDKAA